jgi:hypothetical protein
VWCRQRPAQRALEDRLCARPARHWPSLSGADRDRSVESRECAARGQCGGDRTERGPGLGSRRRASPVAESDHRRVLSETLSTRRRQRCREPSNREEDASCSSRWLIVLHSDACSRERDGPSDR